MLSIKMFLNPAYFRRIFKSFSIYSGTNFFNQAVPFLLLPVLTRFLSARDYGLLVTFLALMSTINIIVSMGTPDAVSRGYFDRGKVGFIFPEYCFNAIALNFVVFGVLTAVILFSGNFLVNNFFLPKWILLILPVIGFCYAVYAILLKFFVFKQKPYPYAFLEITDTVVEISLALIFIVILKFSWLGRVYGIIIDRFLIFGIVFVVMFRNNFLKFSLNAAYFKQIARYGFPIVIHSLGIAGVALVERFFLNKLVGLSATGLYSVGYSIASVVGFVVGAFNLAWSPVLFEKLGQAAMELKKKLVIFTYIYFVLIFCFALLVIFVMPYLIKFFVGKSFTGAKEFIFWIALGFAVHGMYTMVVNYIFYEKKTYLLAGVAFITLILSIVFNFILIKLHGAIGAAQAAFLVFLSRFLLVWFLSNKVYPMPWFSFLTLGKAKSP